MSSTHTDQFSTLAEVSRAVASVLDLDTLLHEIVTIIRRKFDYPYVHLYIVDPIRQQITFCAGSGSRSHRFRGSDGESSVSYDLNAPAGIIPWVARHGQTVIANNVELDARYLRLSETINGESAPTASELTVPLAFRDEVLGVLDVQSDRQNAFSEQDRFLFEALADSVAIAIRNANLYRSERWRRQVADSLHQVAGLLSADVMLEEVLDTVLAQLEQTLPCDLAAVWLLEDDELHVPAIRGPALRHPAGGTHSYAVEPELPDRITPDPNTWVGHALNTEQALIRIPDADSPLAASDPLAEILGFPANHSAIAAPLRAGSQRLGLLTLSHREPGRYGAESQVILTTFASYAAVAIENARLLQEAQEQALISTVMLQVAKVSQSFDALDQVLNAIAELTSQLVGVNRCAVLLRDQTGLAFVPGAAWGLDPAQKACFDQAHLPPGNIPALDELLANGTPVVVYATDENENPGGDAKESRDQREQPTTWLAQIGFESLLLLPLLSQGVVQGVILVECREDFFAGSTSEVLLDQRLVILQGIAYQAATAVENTRLREAQEAEAYVSAALLQVSQAVSSLHTLDEILAAIVRITPILVGVEQCLLFLWEGETTGFRLAQTYGLSSEQQTILARQAYAPDEFGLLDRVRAQNQSLDQSLADQDGEARLPPGWQEHLAREHPNVCSLLAIPLAVHDEVLGVMLLAESQSRSDLLGPHYSYEKRLEIITGIAHQAALTVQNERLQQARLSSERLERELELAREIQQTFIPNHGQGSQIGSGWDVAVTWRAARQVAGDFYDLIELPDNRLGLLVADVADKGMPAALLMALTRTLIRATALEETSPAAVLSRVNNLLVPDAKRGMFVTAAYAVLCLESGQLTYANAGHCLPLLHSCTGQLRRLPKGGMALGVVAGLSFEDHTAELAQGDRLVLYSDGVTEAFSPQGDMYGEDRLHQVLESNTSCSAQTVLDAILTSVYGFTHNAPLTDDLTLLVLHREVQG
jgi:serine phosphatase RsbU (regulator of sigma subunit)